MPTFALSGWRQRVEVNVDHIPSNCATGLVDEQGNCRIPWPIWGWMAGLVNRWDTFKRYPVLLKMWMFAMNHCCLTEWQLKRCDGKERHTSGIKVWHLCAQSLLLLIGRYSQVGAHVLKYPGRCSYSRRVTARHEAIIEAEDRSQRNNMIGWCVCKSCSIFYWTTHQVIWGTQVSTHVLVGNSDGSQTGGGQKSK